MVVRLLHGVILLLAFPGAVSFCLTGGYAILISTEAGRIRTVNPLSVSVSASSVSGGGSTIASGNATSTWTSSASGQLQWSAGWVAENVPGDEGSLAFVQGLTSPDGWQYTFDADQDGEFTLDFDVSARSSCQ